MKYMLHTDFDTTVTHLSMWMHLAYIHHKFASLLSVLTWCSPLSAMWLIIQGMPHFTLAVRDLNLGSWLLRTNDITINMYYHHWRFLPWTQTLQNDSQELVSNGWDSLGPQTGLWSGSEPVWTIKPSIFISKNRQNIIHIESQSKAIRGASFRVDRS